MTSFGNPVKGIIAAEGQPHAVGQFVVTRSFAGHQIATPNALGVDIGDGRCGDPVLAMKAGKVSHLVYLGVASSTSPSRASIVRIDHGSGWSSGYAHLSISVKLGQTVTQGQQIGTVNKIGATACHLHFDTSLNGVRLDSWPLLAQNQEDIVIVTIEKFSPAREWRLVAPATVIGYKFDMATLGSTVVKSTPWKASSSALTDQRLSIESKGLAYLHVVNGYYAGLWVPEDAHAVLRPAVPVPTGFTQEQMDEAKRVAASLAAHTVVEAASVAAQKF